MTPGTVLTRDAHVTIPKFVECNSEHVFQINWTAGESGQT
jgi:hypothetical protein